MLPGMASSTPLTWEAHRGKIQPSAFSPTRWETLMLLAILPQLTFLFLIRSKQMVRPLLRNLVLRVQHSFIRLALEVRVPTMRLQLRRTQRGTLTLRALQALKISPRLQAPSNQL